MTGSDDTGDSGAQQPGLAGIFLRGLAMGAADVVPGVSGGTIALITGIYDRLLTAIASVDASAVTMLLQGRLRALWRRIDGGFLLVLLAGILTAVLTLARIIHGVMASSPLLLWSFFFGLVLASAIVLLRDELARPRRVEILAVLTGAVVAGAISLAPGVAFPLGLTGFVLAGALAICAMILPGISGSFVLLLIGMYSPVIAALKELQIGLLAGFVGGCVVGLMVFSRILHWVLLHIRRLTMGVLGGFLLGSLLTLWPWQRVVKWQEGSERRVLQALPVDPGTYAVENGDPQVLLCLLLAGIGAAVIVGFRGLAADGKPGQA